MVSAHSVGAWFILQRVATQQRRLSAAPLNTAATAQVIVLGRTPHASSTAMPQPAGEAMLKALLDALEQAYSRDTEQPTWDGKGALKAIFIRRAMKWIVERDPAYESLIETGSVLIGRQNCVTSPEHAVALHADTISQTHERISERG